MRRLALLLAALLAAPAAAQGTLETADAAPRASAPVRSGPAADVDAAPMFYVVARDVALRESPADLAPAVAPLRFRDGVRVLDEAGPPADGYAAGWRLVDWNGRRGYVRAAQLSNVWIRVDKSERTDRKSVV